MTREKNRRILIVDDNAAIHEDFQKVLGARAGGAGAVAAAAAALFGDPAAPEEGEGYELDFAAQGQEALAKVEAALAADRPFALAFVDIRMPPGWDGVETLQRLWKADPHLQAVICTAYSDYSWNDMLRLFGETDRLLILKKPFDNVEVRQIACGLTEKWQLAAESRRTNERLQKMVEERTALSQANRQLGIEIAERTRSEQSLRHSEARVRGILDAALDAVISLDAQGRIVEFNRTAQNCLRMSADEARGRSLEEFMPSTDFWTDCRRGLAQADATGASLCENRRYELSGRRASGESFPAEASWTALSTDAETTLIVVLRDVSDRQRLQTQLANSQKLEAIGALAGGVAHEFNNLLQAIQGYTRFAMDGLPTDEQRYQDLEQSLQVSDRAAALTRELLGFSRRQVLVRQHVNANDIVRDASKMLRTTIPADIEIRIELADAAGAIDVDPGLFKQVFLNLCLNARDAMQEGGKLTIATQNIAFDDAYCAIHPDTQPGRYLRLSISDTGCGLSREAQDHLFEPFYTTKEVGQGSGLGLAMVYGVVQQHGGAIHVYSEVGIGTHIRLYLPIADELAAAGKAAAGDDATRFVGKETILIAEDEPLVRDLLVRILNRSGYGTLTAGDGEEAVHVFEANASDISLALLNVVMPKMGGRAVHQAIQMLKPETRVIFCTGYDPDANCNGFVAKEGLQLVQKPFHPATLLKTIRAVLDAEPVSASAQTNAQNNDECLMTNV